LGERNIYSSVASQAMRKSGPQRRATAKPVAHTVLGKSPHAPGPSCSEGLVPLMDGCEAHLDQKQRAAKRVGHSVRALQPRRQRHGARAQWAAQAQSTRHLSTTQSQCSNGWVPFWAFWGVWALVLGGFRKLRATEWFFLGWRSSACDQAADLCAGAKFSASSAGWRNIHFATERVQSSTASSSGSTRC
jgi:hypothetical protein